MGGSPPVLLWGAVPVVVMLPTGQGLGALGRAWAAGDPMDTSLSFLRLFEQHGAASDASHAQLPLWPSCRRRRSMSRARPKLALCSPGDGDSNATGSRREDHLHPCQPGLAETNRVPRNPERFSSARGKGYGLLSCRLMG